MKTSLLALALAATNFQAAYSQDTPVTAPAATVTILTSEYVAASNPCSVFTAQSISFDIEQVLNIGSQSSGAGAGKITFNPFSIARTVDSCSATLLMQAASGTAFKELIAVVESRPVTGGSQTAPPPQTFMVRLGLAAVKTLAFGTNTGSAPQETITLEYGDLTIAQFDAVNGALTSCKGWNRVTNAADNSSCAELQEIAVDRSKGKTR